ncbi:MAG: EamA family transporter [Anaerolineaceae bacterium]
MWILLIVSIAWGFSFGLIKGNLTGVDSNFISFARMALSLLVFLPFIKFKKIHKALFWKLFLAGMLQFGVMYIAYIASFKYLKAYEVALFTIFTPIYVTLINDVLNKKFNALFLVTALLAVAGTWFIERGQILSAGILTGFVLVQLSNLAFAFGQIYYRKLLSGQKEIKDHEVFGVLYLGAATITLMATLIFTPLAAISLSGKQIWTLIYLGIFASGICFFLWNLGARKVDAGALAIFNDLKIPMAVAISLLIFGEQTNWLNLLIGGLIVAASLVLNEVFLRKRITKQEISETSI